MADITERIIIPEVPRVLDGQELYVYIQAGGADLNLENGAGTGSIQQKGYYRNNEYKEGGSALGKSSIALNKGTTAYMVGDTAIGGSTVAGMTEDEFNAYYWDSTNNVPLHEGKGLINNKITDNEGRDYTQAISCAFASGDATTAKYRASFASGSRVNTSDKEQAVFGAFVGKGGNYISDSRYNDEDMRFIVGCGNDWSTSGNRFALAKHSGHAYFPHKITIRNNAEDDMDVPSYKQMKDYAGAAAKNYIYPSKDIYALKWYSTIVTRRGFNVGANEGAQANKITAGWYGLVGGNNSTNRQTDSLVFGQYLEGSGSNDSSSIARAGSATLGAFNVRNDDAVLTIGNGLDTNRRSNALTVLWDGRAKVQSAPVESDDVVRKSELDTKLDKGLIPSQYLPSYVDDVVEYDSKSDFPTDGESGKIYVDTSTNQTYRWSGTTYIQVGGADLNIENGTGDVLIQTTDTPCSFKVMTDHRAQVYGEPAENDDVVRLNELHVFTQLQVDLLF